MITDIGITAGEILTLLEDQKAPLKISDAINLLDTPKDIVHMSIGWLSREGYIKLSHRNDQFYISELENGSLLTA